MTRGTLKNWHEPTNQPTIIAINNKDMMLLFTCGMKAHTPVMYTGSEQSWNGGREGKIMVTWGGFIKTFVHNVCI